MGAELFRADRQTDRQTEFITIHGHLNVMFIVEDMMLEFLL